MKITLINPPYPPHAHSHPPFIPLGIAYLGAVAEQAGHDVTVVDCQAEKLNYQTFENRIRRHRHNRNYVTLQLSKNATKHRQTKTPQCNHHNRRKPCFILGRKRPQRMFSTRYRR